MALKKTSKIKKYKDSYKGGQKWWFNIDTQKWTSYDKDTDAFKGTAYSPTNHENEPAKIPIDGRPEAIWEFVHNGLELDALKTWKAETEYDNLYQVSVPELLPLPKKTHIKGSHLINSFSDSIYDYDHHKDYSENNNILILIGSLIVLICILLITNFCSICGGCICGIFAGKYHSKLDNENRNKCSRSAQSSDDQNIDV